MSDFEHEPLIIEGARSILFVLFFLISIYLSYHHSPLLFGITVGAGVLYAVLIVGWWLRKQREKERR
ncbi:hypothetical protein [uncultured Porphyromonas sp.]|uniref:hypothetical protein n=1 Tax=uncultured Porphyromonas sp. TaxID=159274 RepID=UPI00261CC385|nr:hypothetical protein [uncultured Porphyromonas sp.]